MTTESKQWVDRLAFMGEEQIRDLLVSKGITGVPTDPDHCPVAEFLAGETGQRHVVGPTIIVSCTGQEPDRPILTPKSLAAFILKFDCGYYPELISSEGDGS